MTEASVARPQAECMRQPARPLADDFTLSSMHAYDVTRDDECPTATLDLHLCSRILRARPWDINTSTLATAW